MTDHVVSKICGIKKVVYFVTYYYNSLRYTYARCDRHVEINEYFICLECVIIWKQLLGHLTKN
jgi:hypothetical protein